MAKYDLTKAVIEDLYRIWDYTVDTWSESQADLYDANLKKAFLVIANKPYNRGQDYYFIYPGLRGYHVGHHIVFYTVQENGRVLIVRILDERMDFKRHF